MNPTTSSRPLSFRAAPTFLSLRASAHTGVGIRPRARRRGNPFFMYCLRRGTFVSSDKSTQKRRLKLRFKTSSARCALCQTCFIFLAQSDFPCAVVRQKDCATTAFRYRFAAAASCHGSRFPLYRRTGALPIPTQPLPLELSFRASPQAGVGIRTPLKPPPGALNNVCGATRRTYPCRRSCGGRGAI